MRKRSVRSRLLPGVLGITLGAVLTIPGTSASVSAQALPPQAPATHLDLRITASLLAQAVGAQAPAAQAAAPSSTRRLTVEDAVRLALENNLGIQIARFSPQ